MSVGIATVTVAGGVCPTTPRSAVRGPWRLVLCLAGSALLLLTMVSAGVGTQVYRQYHAPTQSPAIPPLDLFGRFYDLTPTRVLLTRGWLKFTVTVPRHQFVSDPTLWRQMHFEDWDMLDAGARREGLTRMLAHHGHLVADPQRWRRMTAPDWDEVPQPVRAMAIVGMIEHWMAYYGVGAALPLDPALVLRTAKALAMSESWFEHRALHVNADGSTDLGIGGASSFARHTLRSWHDRGLVDFTLQDDEYFNPWLAARWLAFWWRLTLDEAQGDLELATRAYNVGIGRARAGEGQEYLSGVERRRRRYFEGPSDSPTWSVLSQYRRDQLWLPRVVVRVPLPAHPPSLRCTDEACGLPPAARMVVPDLP